MHTDVTTDVNDQAVESTLAEATTVVVDPETRASLEARREEIAITFDHAHKLPLEKAELALEYFNITEELELGQDVQNPRPGRPGIISKMARELAVPGRTEAGRRKWLERALAVAAMSTEAKLAAREAGLARYQSTLLKIAEAGEKDDQLKKVAEIAARKREHTSRPTGQRLLTSRVVYPADRKEKVLAALTTFAEQQEVELLP